MLSELPETQLTSILEGAVYCSVQVPSEDTLQHHETKVAGSLEMNLELHAGFLGLNY